MKTVSYKGYQASVEYEDGTLFIKVLHIDDLLLCQCEKASEVEPSVRVLIDDYLKTCAAIGKQPTKPFKGTFNVRIDPDLHKKAAWQAAESGQSLNAFVSSAILKKVG